MDGGKKGGVCQKYTLKLSICSQQSHAKPQFKTSIDFVHKNYIPYSNARNCA